MQKTGLLGEADKKENVHLQEPENEVEGLQNELTVAVANSEDAERRKEGRQQRPYGAAAERLVQEKEKRVEEAQRVEHPEKKRARGREKKEEVWNKGSTVERKDSLEGFTSGSLVSPRSHDVALSFNGCRVHNEVAVRPKESQAYTPADEFTSWRSLGV